ncbi:hypothetical protein SAMN05192563_10388 [Paraburkholderia aspalathi]|uniref:Uncharacterized protein n=1 Tax=Paraburkholderia aspalathi TaxID=1324617 RepID=A0A1I7ENM6_9BURK|nr:hypothetical protein SAMN05192563_10388 [Paraburkholderia aspalathi]
MAERGDFSVRSYANQRSFFYPKKTDASANLSPLAMRKPEKPPLGKHFPVVYFVSRRREP